MLSAVVKQTLGALTLSPDKAESLPLSYVFADSAVKAGDTVVDLRSSSGSIPVELTNSATPATVANFLKYVSLGYANTIIHRDIPGFVVQAGGYTTAGTHIPTFGTVAGESATATLKNTTDTLAMALSTGPNSATTEFFVNLANNPFLDDASDGGPFTAFGKVIYNGLNVINSISAVGQVDASQENPAFATLPVNNKYSGKTGDASKGILPLANFNPISADNLVTLDPVVLPDSGLKFTAVSSDPALVSASITDGVLSLIPGPGATPGNASVTVTATDLGGGTASTVIPVVYSATPLSRFTPTGITFHAVAGQPYASSVGEFSYDSYYSSTVIPFSATIDYGDTGGGGGQVAYVKQDQGGLQYNIVLGGHGYTSPGTYPVTVTIGDPRSTWKIHSTAIITAAETSGSTLTPTPITFKPVVNQAYAASVGGFSFSDATAKATDFIAHIDYGDTGGAAGTVVSTSPGVFSVIGGHGYSATGNLPVTVTISGPGGSSTIIHSTAQVQAAIGGGTTTLTPTGITFHPQPGKPYAATVGGFASSDPTARASDFTAYIDYGDTGGFAGNIFQTAPGVFNVIGGHGYAAGNFSVIVTITGRDGIKTVINSMAAVG